MKIFDITNQDKNEAIEKAKTKKSAGAFLMIAYNKIIAELKEDESIDPNLVYISNTMFDWIHDAPKKNGLDTPEQDWAMFLVNKSPMADDSIPENKIYWFESYEEKKKFKNI